MLFLSFLDVGNEVLFAFYHSLDLFFQEREEQRTNLRRGFYKVISGKKKKEKREKVNIE